MRPGYSQFVNMNASKRKAMQDKEEWVTELHRFDFDRVHSTTNLRTFLSDSAVGGTIISANKNYLATLRDDGNFVVYVSSHFVPSNIVWQTNTAGKGHAPFRLSAQEDGDIALYDSNNHVLWSSGYHLAYAAPRARACTPILSSSRTRATLSGTVPRVSYSGSLDQPGTDGSSIPYWIIYATPSPCCFS